MTFVKKCTKQTSPKCKAWKFRDFRYFSRIVDGHYTVADVCNDCRKESK